MLELYDDLLTADEACEGYGYAKLWEHRGPCRSEHGVRKSQRYEGDVYHDDQCDSGHDANIATFGIVLEQYSGISYNKSAKEAV